MAHEIGTRVHDKLLAGSAQETVTQPRTILSGQNLARGTVLGRVTASGKYKIYQSGSGDGSENPVAILAEDVDASAADKEGIIYTTGEFNKDALIFDGADTFNTAVEDALRQLNIHGKGNIDDAGIHNE